MLALSTDKPEEWVFDSKEGCSKQCFDITNDVNGDLHNVAQQNILVFVNETDGKEQASVHARRDLFSHVHYLVGPGENDAELSIPYGEWTELKIDYGENYERVRIRKGYSRLSKDSPDRARMEGENLDSTTLHDTQYWCARETKISLDFLLNLDLKAMHSRPRVQTLVISLCLYNRLIVIKDEFEESEFVTLTHRVLDLVKKILKSEGVSDELLEETFKQSNAFGNAMHLAIFLDTTPDLIIHHVSAENIRNAIRSRLRVLRKETA